MAMSLCNTGDTESRDLLNPLSYRCYMVTSKKLLVFVLQITNFLDNTEIKLHPSAICNRIQRIYFERDDTLLISPSF